MKTYKVESNIVKELNANVAVLTFPGKGRQLADLYYSKNESPVLVKHDSCAPVDSVFKETVIVEF